MTTVSRYEESGNGAALRVVWCAERLGIYSSCWETCIERQSSFISISCSKREILLKDMSYLKA